MKNRLQTILNLEKISAAQLSQLLGIQRSTLSNLMSGRNNPSYDFILATMTKLPNLNTEWLLRGEGQPYKNPEKNFRGQPLDQIKTEVPDPDQNFFGYTEVQEKPSTNLFGFPEKNTETHVPASEDFPEIAEDFPSEDEIEPYHPFPPLEEGELARRVKSMQPAENKKVIEKNTPSEPSENPKFEEKPDSSPQISTKRVLKKIILLYSDGSFEDYNARL